MSETRPADPKLCPACGKPNGCAREKDANATDCWCAHIDVDLRIFDGLPLEIKNKSCLCRECLTNDWKQ